MPASDYTPGTADVATFLRARTRDTDGNIVGDFTDETNPTGDQVTASIAEAVDELSEAIGADIPADSFSTAKRVASLLAAANVEMSYYPEQAAANNSMYDKLMTRYNSALVTLTSSIEEEEEEQQDEDQEEIDPSGAFPAASNWGTVSW